MSKHLSALLAAVLILTCTPRLQAQIVISTYAGTPNNAGYSGDGGHADSALLDNPSDILLDKIGNLYIADFLNNVVRKVDTNGIITTIAGTGFGAGVMAGGGWTGDNGPATAAELNGPFALAMDTVGNIFFADGYNHNVRKISTTGIITNVAGNHFPGYSGNNGPATAASINNPVGLAFDKHGNLYIADDHNAVIRKIDTGGIITTFAGNHIVGYSGDSGLATAAQLGAPIGVAVDTFGNVYIADSGNVIRKVNTLGIITTFAGTGIAGYSGDNGPATAAKLNRAQRVNVDDSNNVYLSDVNNNVVRKVNAITGIITTYAGDGTGLAGYFGDGGPADSALLSAPEGVAVSKSGIVYISDRGNDIIRRVGPAIPPVVSGISAVNNNTRCVLTVYPNPSNTGYLTLNLASASIESVTMTMVNVLGETVSKITSATNRPVTLKLNQPAGVYFINASTAHGKWTQQVVVE